ncbi:DUF2510 domain-containing protein [Agromyces mariniharenae]|uniref:DUF2510 domain-containing protein n=1 Tax=Agromyces mariniharenae TaxID=2604423 RepID=A0A5S4V801_9MICO|nr:DUF2510 domain-containing protein [Agromyces mariniharenae]TYL54003.1 DUF2510 domain-containing protein [Agromyces mariniharenae]
MSDPTKAPAGWYEDGSGGRRYWDGEAWTQYTAPGASESAAGAGGAAGADATPTSPIGNNDATVPIDGPTIPYVWGSGAATGGGSAYGEGVPAASGYGDSTTVPSGWNDPTARYDDPDLSAFTASPTAPTENYGAQYAAPYPPQPTAVMTAQHPFTEPSNPPPNVVGIIALVVAIAGFVFAVIPDVMGVAWILLPVAFVLSLVGLFARGAKWPAITGLIISIVATIVGIVVFVNALIGSFGDVWDTIDEAIPDATDVPQPGDDAPFGEPEQPALPVENLAFGDTMTWDDGVALTVSAPEPYTPSPFAVGSTLADNVVFTMTITNNSTENLQPVPFPTLTSADQEASQIFDVGEDLEGNGDDVGIPPTAIVPPGGSVSWRVAWSVADPASLTMEASPSFAYANATFTNVP